MCAGACPLDAIAHPAADASAVEAELEVLLRRLPPPRLVAFRCRADRTPLPDPWLDVPLPCAAATTLVHVLDAIRHDADGVAVLAAARRCLHGHAPDVLERRGRTWRALLQALGVEPQRLLVATSAQDGLRAFAAAVSALPSRKPMATDSTVQWEAPGVPGAPTLRARLALMAQTTESPPDPVNCADAPLAVVQCDPARCTLCGACAGACATGALRMDARPEDVVLRFDHALCPGCGACEALCPEGALRLTEGVHPYLLQGPVMLARDQMRRCRTCGTGFAPLRLTRNVEARVAGPRGGPAWLTVDLCPECRGARVFA
jgi:ferredoxin